MYNFLTVIYIIVTGSFRDTLGKPSNTTNNTGQGGIQLLL